MDRSRNGFTALRLCAAFLVLVTHSFVLLGRGDADPLARVTRYLSFSSVGVDVFFAISGYLICSSILREPSPIRYLQNRGLRILPALIAVTILTVFVIGPIMSIDTGYWHRIATYDYLVGIFLYPWKGFLPGVFTSNPVAVVNGSLWTLPLEFTCYLLILAASWCRALNCRSLALVVIISLTLHLCDSFAAGQSVFGMDLLNLNRLGVIFCVGALLASLKERIAYSRAAAATAVVIIFAAWHLGQTNWHRFAAIYLVLMPYVTITLALHLPCLHRLDRWDISYGFYLYAFSVQQIIIAELGPRVSVASLILIASFATAVCATMSWVFIERPMLTLKSRSARDGRRSAGLDAGGDVAWYSVPASTS